MNFSTFSTISKLVLFGVLGLSLGCGPARSNNDALNDQEDENFAVRKSELAQAVGTYKGFINIPKTKKQKPVTLTIVAVSRPADNTGRNRVSSIPSLAGSLLQDPTEEDGRNTDGKLPDPVPIAQYQSGDFSAKKKTLYLFGTTPVAGGSGTVVFELDGTLIGDRIQASVVTSYQGDCTIDVSRVNNP